jgi:hypothetical protein
MKKDELDGVFSEDNTKIKNTEENREILAEEIVDSWDMDDLRQYAIDRLDEYMRHQNDEEFELEWKTFYQDDHMD